MDALNVRQKLALVVMDVLLLAELTLCVWWSYQDKANMPYLFMRSYIPLCLGTLLGFKFLMRRLRDKDQGEALQSGEA